MTSTTDPLAALIASIKPGARTALNNIDAGLVLTDDDTWEEREDES